MLFAPQQTGQGLVEYAIILAFVFLVVIVVLRMLGPQVGNSFSSINNSIPN
jgi:pilus assembly protein Flp/PilA